MLVIAARPTVLSMLLAGTACVSSTSRLPDSVEIERSTTLPDGTNGGGEVGVASLCPREGVYVREGDSNPLGTPEIFRITDRRIDVRFNVVEPTWCGTPFVCNPDTGDICAPMFSVGPSRLLVKYDPDEMAFVFESGSVSVKYWRCESALCADDVPRDVDCFDSFEHLEWMLLDGTCLVEARTRIPELCEPTNKSEASPNRWHVESAETN